jgi:hypothetical protein
VAFASYASRIFNTFGVISGWGPSSKVRKIFLVFDGIFQVRPGKKKLENMSENCFILKDKDKPIRKKKINK